MVTINYWAVLVSGVAMMVLGGLWYSPLLFGNIWIKLSGFSQKDMEKAKQKGMAASYFFNFVATLVMAYILAHFVDYVDATTWQDGLLAGFWIWLGFIATVSLASVLWEGKPFSLYLINIAYYLVGLPIMGVILTLWA